ncbi:hypothetical protein COO60DRAFT_397478 [Scenedesmus sp. NREL 46B-D3]|nr:hypothetical protein COO60DRAFT_397478 [Scenedesmus sp. NREL 46B-D3]
MQQQASAGRAEAAAQAAAVSSSLEQAQQVLRAEFEDKLNDTELALTGRVQSDLAGKAAAASEVAAKLEGIRLEWRAAVEASGAAAAAQLEVLQQQLAALATAQQEQDKELLGQAAAAAGSALAERMSSFKLSLLSELEAGLLGTWGSQVKAAAAAEAAQRVEAGLQASEQRLKEEQAALLEQLAGAVGGQVAAGLQELKAELCKQVAVKAAADAAEAYASTKREVTSGLEKKMHAALDAALVTLKAEAAETAKKAAAAQASQLAGGGGGGLVAAVQLLAGLQRLLPLWVSCGGTLRTCGVPSSAMRSGCCKRLPEKVGRSQQRVADVLAAAWSAMAVVHSYIRQHGPLWLNRRQVYHNLICRPVMHVVGGSCTRHAEDGLGSACTWGCEVRGVSIRLPSSIWRNQ